MISAHIINILRSLDGNETERFNDFVYSPFHNKSKTIHKFWEILRKYYPEYKDEFMDKEYLFRLIFGAKKYNYGTMKNLIQTFLELLESFLNIVYHEEDRFQVRYNELAYCIIKFYPDLFKKKFSQVIKEYGKISEGADNHFIFKYQLLRLSASFGSLESKESTILFDQGDTLIHFMLIQLFQIHYNIKVFYNSKNLIQQDNQVEALLNSLSLIEIIDNVRKNNPEAFKAVNLYYYMYLCTDHPENDENFYTYIKLYLNSHKFLHRFEFEGLANTVINIFTNRSYLGIEGTSKETDEFIKKIIKLKVEFGNTDNRISIVHFSKTLKCFFEAEDSVYAQKFFEKYKSRLIEKDKEPMDNYYTANTYYLKKDYNKALEYANKIKAEPGRFKIFIKEFQLKCYYELDEAVQFNYTLKAFRLLVYREDSLNMNRKEYTKNFLNVINALFDCKVDKKQKLDDVKIEIKKNKMVNKEWIIQKLNEIEKK